MIEKLLNNLNVDRQEFLFQFQSHPNYPSALAFSDTLNFLGVKNEAYNLEKEYWDDLPNDFITIYNHDFALIKKEDFAFKVFSEDVKLISKEDLYKNAKDFVLLFETDEKTKIKEKFNLKYTIFALLAFILIYSALFLQLNGALFNLLSILGLYVSLELFNKKFGQESVVLNNICGGSPTKPQENCSKIIDSDKIKFFGLKLSDFSLVYFISILLLGIALPVDGFVLKIVAAFSSLVILYSLYKQIIVEKIICKICLLIVSILIFQIALSEIYFNYSFALNIVFISVFVFAVVFISLIFINNLLIQNDVLKKSNLKNLRFKRNYDLFKRELLNKEKILFKDNFSGFYIGNIKVKVHISVVSNPYCGFCKNAHEILEKLHLKYPEEISFQIRFNHLPNAENQNLNTLMQNLFSIYSKSEKTFLDALHFWFEKRDLQVFNKEFLINGYQFPDKYDREDIFYFIDDLLEDEEILNGL